jgi:hypothetical protein
MSNFAVLLNLLSDDVSTISVLKPLLLLGREIQILESHIRLRIIPPRNREVRNQLLRKTQPGARVRREINPRDAQAPCKLRALVEELVLLRAKRASLERNIICDDDKLSPVRILGRLCRDDPADHANRIQPGLSVDLDKLIVVVEHELAVLDALA